MRFTDIPVRGGENVNPSWWNSLRAAGLRLERFLGLGLIEETHVSLSDNTSADITALLFDSALYSSVTVSVEVRRENSVSNLVAVGTLTAIYKPLTGWELVEGPLNGDDTGTTFAISVLGQVSYTTNSMGGTGYVGALKFKAMTFSI